MALRWATRLVLAAWSLVLLAWLTLHWGILPRLDGWRPQIEQRLGAAIGAPLRIGAIRVRSGSWVPAFEVDDVRLLDGEGRIALHLGRVSAALSPSALLTLSPRLSQLHLEGVRLDVRRDAAGRITVAGLDLAGGGEPSDPALAEWFFEQPEFVIRHGRLRWTDELRDAPPLVLDDVDLVLRNGRRRHEVRLDATPPADWGARFALRGRFTQPFTARAGDWQRWSGTLYADLPLADVSELRRHVALPFALGTGRGAVRSWIDVEAGQPVQATLDLALSAVALQLAPELPELALAQVQGRLSARRDAAGTELGLEALRFVADDGLAWAPTTARLAWRQAPDAADGSAAPITGGTLRINQLALAPLTRLAARLPLPPALHEALDTLAPQGSLQDVAVDWRGTPQAPQGWRVQARGQALALRAGPPGPPAFGRPVSAGRPGLRGADFTLDATEAGGQAQLTLKNGALVFPGVFEQPELPLASLAAALSWRVQPAAGDAPPAVELTVRDASFANADLRGTLGGRWRTGAGSGFGEGGRFPGQIELDGKILSGAAERVARYLPLGLPAETRSYVARAVGPGRLSDGEVQVKGDLWHFPYADGTAGTFRIRARAQALRLAYIPDEPGWTSPWPAMTGVAGALEFDRGAMRFRDAQATLSGVALRGVNGGIDDLAGRPVLKLEGQARGALRDMLRFVNATPVGGWIGGALAEASGTGPAELALALSIPLDGPATSEVRGGLQLAGNDLRLLPGTPLLAGARGRVDFTQAGVTVVGGRARVLGGEASFDGGTQPDGTLRFAGQGQATAEGLLKPGELPVLAVLAPQAGRLRGQAPYKVQLSFTQGQPEVLVTSPLTGLALDLPPPLTKSAAASWPLRVQTRRPAERAGVETVAVDLGEPLQLRLERDVASANPRVLRGSWGLGSAAPPLPAAGVDAVVRAPRLDLDAWRAIAAGSDASGTAAGAPGGSGIDDSFFPTQTDLRTPELRLAGRRWTDVQLTLQRQAALAETQWRAQVRAEQGQGSIEFRQPREAGAPGRVLARLARMDWPAAESGLAGEEGVPAAPASVPALDLQIDALRVGGLALGRLELEAVNRPAPDRPGLREWQLDRLRLAAPDAELLASGRWSAGRRTALDVKLALADSGRFAERLGAGRALEGGKGTIEGTLGWAGSPLLPDPATMRGNLNVALAEGRFLNAEPGAARLLGVLSLQALPRRLLLDFRDVFEKGFAFDQVTGDLTLVDGVARTNNLKLAGVQAVVLIEGSADLRRETQDLRIVAVPEINAGTASLAYAVINPAVGLGSFLAQWLLREPLMAAGTREFRVTGPWAEPQVERIARGAAPSTGAAASAPMTPESRTP